MKKIKSFIYIILSYLLLVFGRINARIIFIKDFQRFKKLSNDGRFNLNKKDLKPCLNDNTLGTGFDRHYLYHPAWAARALSTINPKMHVDISSTLNFSAIVSAFVPVEFYDFRPADIKLNNLKCSSADVLSLPFNSDSIESLSCMHVVEHVGLGRYGDKLDPGGDLKAIAELKRVLASNGNLLFVVPVGRPKVMFNAHRIYSYNQVLDFFKGFELIQFALIPERQEDGGLDYSAASLEVDKQSYGCGCFWFRK